MRVIVTGSNGFLGKNLVIKLINQGHEVIAIDINEINYSHVRLTKITCDLLNIDKYFFDKKIDAIFHTAAKIAFDSSFSCISELTNSNILAISKLADFIINNNIKRVFFSSTCSVYKENYLEKLFITEDHKIQPINLYAITKLTGELVLENLLKGFVNEYVILRYSSIYGFGQKNQSILPIFIAKASTNDLIQIFGSGNRIQNYVYIDDVVNANINCLNSNLEYNTVLNIGSNEQTTDLSLALMIKSIWNSSSQIEVLNKNVDKETYFNYSIDKAKVMINYNPISLENGLLNYYSFQS